MVPFYRTGFSYTLPIVGLDWPKILSDHPSFSTCTGHLQARTGVWAFPYHHEPAYLDTEDFALEVLTLRYRNLGEATVTVPCVLRPQNFDDLP